MTLSTVGTSTLPAMPTVPSPFLLFLFPLPSFLSRFVTTFPPTLLPILFSLLFLFLFLGRWIFLGGSWVDFLGWWIFWRRLAMRFSPCLVFSRLHRQKSQIARVRCLQ